MPVEHKKLRDQVVEEIQRIVREGGLQAGDALPPERELSSTLGVSRTVVREALTSLEMQGMLELVPGRTPTLRKQFSKAIGNTLQHLVDADGKSVVELNEIRQIFETQISGLAARRASEADVSRLRSALTRMEQHIDEPEGYIVADAAFHDALLEAAGNEVLVHLMRPVGALLLKSRELTVGRRRPPTTALSEHRQILARVEAGDEEGARAAMESHLNETAADLSACFIQVEPGAAQRAKTSRGARRSGAR